jgi:ABC-2 type transport system permease protein
MSSFLILIKREYWEHHSLFLYKPAILAFILFILLVLGGITNKNSMDNYNIMIQSSSDSSEKNITIDVNENINTQTSQSNFSLSKSSINHYSSKNLSIDDDHFDNGAMLLLKLSHHLIFLFFSFILFFSCFLYSLKTLYQEKKDRSILFWKSMPITNNKTVLSKISALVLLIPFCHFLVILALQLCVFIGIFIFYWIIGFDITPIWSTFYLVYIENIPSSLLTLIMSILWLAPLWSLFFLASVLSKSSPFFSSTLFLILMWIGEKMIFGSHIFMEQIGNRVSKAFSILYFNTSLDQKTWGGNIPLESINGWMLFSSPSFWFGLGIALLLLMVSSYSRGRIQ